MNGITPLGGVPARLARALWFLLALAALGAGGAWAQDDPPGRVGRLADMQGQVWWFDPQDGQWSEAERNRPLTGGDRVSTAPQAHAELRVGSTVLRLGGATELEVLALDDQRMSFQLHSGSLALRVRSREVAEEIELVTDEARLRPLRSGHYRLDRIDDTSHAGSWRGSLRIDDADGFVVDTGQRVELWREGSSRELRHAWGSLPDDAFGEWALRSDQRDERSAATRHVSPEMTGAEDLDRYGRWDRHPEYGALWFPLEVHAGWVPYRDGRWVWARPWGWTWVDAAPWGFAPFHYGRWVNWRGRWGWWPGDYVVRPVFAPALVAWVGGAHWGVSINIGGPAIGWVPLAPREVFVPWYRTTPIYVDRINRHPPRPGRKPVPQVPTGPVMYGNQGVPGAVTVVPRDVLVHRQPVSRAVVDPRGAGTPGQPLVAVVPPPAPAPRADGRGPAQRPPLSPRADRHDPRESRERVGPPPLGGRVEPMPAERRDTAPAPDRRRDRPQPADPSPRRDPVGPLRPPLAGTTVPQPAAATVAPTAPTAPAAPAAPLAPAAPAAAALPAAPTTAGPAVPARAEPRESREPRERVGPPPSGGYAAPRPEERRDPGSVNDRRRERPPPANASPRREITPAPVAPAVRGAVAPVAPAAAVPASPPPRASPPPPRPAPAPAEAEARRDRDRDDDRQRSPDSRRGPRDNPR